MIIGDLNCDVSKIPMDIHALSLHQLDQLIIDKPTRVTEASSTVIDLVHFRFIFPALVHTENKAIPFQRFKF